MGLRFKAIAFTGVIGQLWRGSVGYDDGDSN